MNVRVGMHVHARTQTHMHSHMHTCTHIHIHTYIRERDDTIELAPIYIAETILARKLRERERDDTDVTLKSLMIY